MADSRKTEKPTPKKLREAREKGEVPRSIELSATVQLFASLILFLFLIKYIMYKLLECFYNNFSSIPFYKTFDFNVLKRIIFTEGMNILLMLLPVSFVLFIVGFLTGALQVGGIKISSKAINIDLKKINPVNGFKKLFSMRSWIELLKGLFKIGVVFIILYIIVKKEKENLLLLGGIDVYLITKYFGYIAGEVFKKIILFFIILAVLDYIWQRYDFYQNMKMTKEEVKEEIKQTEGDIKTKTKIKQWHKKRLKHRMIANVKKATFITVNPDHYAVAIRYVRGMKAPRVIAKGIDEVAQRIKKEAKKHNIPVIHNPELTRKLYYSVDIGKYIPVKFYKSVAKILAFIYKMERQKGGK